jgi:uncharacterized phage-associated protein
MFSEERVTQMAAYLLMRGGKRMAYIKLLKLLYLAEREALAKWGESISGDHFVSMPHGPILSQTYDLIKGHTPSIEVCPWQKMIRDESNYEVSLLNDIDIEDLDELSPAEIKILDDTFNKFGHMSRFEIVDFTHSNCPEWEDPRGSSFPISPENIFRAMGKTEDQVQKLFEKYREQQQLDSLKSQLI